METGLSSDISSGSPGYCVLRETTPVIAITQAGRAAHTHTNTHTYIQYTGPKQPQAHTHTHTLIFVSILMSTLKNIVPRMFSAK